MKLTRKEWLDFLDTIIQMDNEVVKNVKTDLHNKFALQFIDVRKILSNTDQ